MHVFTVNFLGLESAQRVEFLLSRIRPWRPRSHATMFRKDWSQAISDVLSRHPPRSAESFKVKLVILGQGRGNDYTIFTDQFGIPAGGNVKRMVGVDLNCFAENGDVCRLGKIYWHDQ